MRGKVMDAIHEGAVRMRPRWHFLLLSMLGVVGALILLLALVYSVSLMVFFLRASGAWFLPAFGGRGWLDFFRSLPWLLIALLALLVLVLEAAVSRYSFVYKKPLALSAIAIIAVVLLGGLALAQTPLHRQLARFARDGLLPAPLHTLYRPPFHMRSGNVYHGTIVAPTTRGFIMTDRGESTTSVVIMQRTRLPYGEDFAPGDTVVVIGDSNTMMEAVEAFGIRKVENEIPNED